MLPREGHSLRQSFGFCRWYSGVNQFPQFDMDTSFAFLILKHLASLESSKAQKRILGMKDYQHLKLILESKDCSCETAEGHDDGEVPIASRSPPPSKPSAKRRLDLFP